MGAVQSHAIFQHNAWNVCTQGRHEFGGIACVKANIALGSRIFAWSNVVNHRRSSVDRVCRRKRFTVYVVMILIVECEDIRDDSSDSFGNCRRTRRSVYYSNFFFKGKICCHCCQDVWHGFTRGA